MQGPYNKILFEMTPWIMYSVYSILYLVYCKNNPMQWSNIRFVQNYNLLVILWINHEWSTCADATDVSCARKYMVLLCTVKPVCNDHLSNKSYYLWFIQYVF